MISDLKVLWTREKFELLTYIGDFTTPFYVLLRFEFESSIRMVYRVVRDRRMWFTIRSFDSAFHDFTFLMLLKGLLKRVSYLLIFLIQENEVFISVTPDPLFFFFVNRPRGPHSLSGATLVSRRPDLKLSKCCGISPYTIVWLRIASVIDPQFYRQLTATMFCR